MKTRGELIRQARLMLGLTQEALAEAAHISQQAYSDIEADKTAQPRRSALRAIAHKLELPEEVLILNRPGPVLSKEALRVAEEYETLPPAIQAKILMTLIEAKRAA